MGLDAWSDMDVIASFLAGLLEGRSAESLGEDAWEDLEDALERMAQREPFLQTTFYRRPVNKAFRAGRHLQMMHQQLM